MAVRKVIRMGHPHLRRVAEDVKEEFVKSSEFKELIADMFETMKAYEGIGLAAPQIDVNLKLAIIELPVSSPRYEEVEASEKHIIINPKIETLDESVAGCWEGCLSVPGLRGFVERPQKIKLTFRDENFEQREEVFEGFLATVVQHELDHLFGKLYIDHLKSNEFLAYQEEFDQFIQPSGEEVLD